MAISGHRSQVTLIKIACVESKDITWAPRQSLGGCQKTLNGGVTFAFLKPCTVVKLVHKISHSLATKYLC